MTDRRAAPVRRRGAQLEHALLAAAWEELLTVGYANLSMDGVAARARTSKPVLYRRWRTRPELVLAALRQRGPLLSGKLPDTGSLRGDVLALLERMSAGLLARGTGVILGLLGDYLRDPELLAYLRPLIMTQGHDVMQILLRRAAERGEIPSASVSPRVASLPIDLLRHEFLVTQSAAAPEVLIDIVDDIFLPLVCEGRMALDLNKRPEVVAGLAASTGWSKGLEQQQGR
jgi:AcrR family transcriptional regulator